MMQNYFSTSLKVILYLILLFTNIKGFSQTVLVEGDIALTRINMDDDSFSFVVLVPIANTTQFIITDEAWNGFSLLTNESAITFTATSSFTAGEEISITTAFSLGFTSTGAGTATLTSTGSNNPIGGNMLGAAGDNIFIYQTTPPGENDFISGINANGGVTGSPGNAWSLSSSSSNSFLPAGLTNGTNALGIFPSDGAQSEVDNARYKSTALRSGDKATVLAAIMDLNNWEYDNNTAYPAVGASFTITGGNTAPVIAGTSAGQAVNDNSTLLPFSTITTTDADGDNLSATITLDNNAKGVLTGDVSGSGPYTISSRNPAAMQTALRALSFNPTDNRSGTSEATTFTVVIDDGAATDTNNTTTVISSAVAPVVNEVNSFTANGTYSAGSDIIISVTFSENIIVTGTPQITLETGTTDRTVNYNGTGSGSNTLLFTYTVQSDDESADLDYLATNSLTAGTSILDAGGKSATLTLPTPGAANSLGANKAIVIDGVAPTDPVITSPSSVISVNATTQTISGTHTENGVVIHAYADADNNGTADNTTSLGSATVIGNVWSFAVNLTADSANNFVVQAKDTIGNTSNDVDVPTITEDSMNPADPLVTTPATAITVGTTTQTISGTHTENGVTVHAYIDVDNNGTADNTTSLGSAIVTGNTWSFAVNLTADSANNFVVEAEDTAANTSNDVDVPTITQSNTITWTGTTSNDWHTASNWDTNSLPTAASDVIIPNTGITNYPTISSAVTVNTIDINSGASLIANTSVSAQVTYSRNLPTTNWYLVGAPVSGETQQDVIANHTFASGTIGGNIGVAAFDNNSPTNAWTYSTLSSTGSIFAGFGSSMKLAAPGDVSITGNLITANYDVPVNIGARNSFNLLGNPFPSYINSATLAGDNSVVDNATFWFWDGTQYVTHNNANPIEIAPAQGFFIESNANSIVTYNTSNQSHQSSDTFMRTEPNSYFELFIENDGNKKSTKVFYVEGKTKGFDNGYDSKMFGGVTYDLAVYTQLLSENDGRKLAIQTLPKINYEDMVIPVGVIARANETLTFSIESLNLPESINVFLEDRVNNKFINLTEKEYKITLKEESKDVGQFYIHTNSSKSLSIDDNLNLDNVSIYKTNNSNLRVTGLPTGNTNLTIYNMLGKQVKQTTFNSNGVKDISLPNLAAGVYLVKLKTVNGKLNKKIILE